MKKNYSPLRKSGLTSITLLISLVMLSVFVKNTYAQVGTPSYFNITNTSSTNTFPLNNGTSNKVQWIYGPGAFSSAGGGSGTPAPAGSITKVYIRFSATVNGTNPYSNFTISMAQNVGTATTMASSTYVTGLTTCFTQASGFTFAGISTGLVWYGVNLTTPFTYDPSLSLVMEIKTSNTTAAGNTVISFVTTGVNQRIYGSYASATGTAATGMTPTGFDIAVGGCTNPPTAGTSTATPSSGMCTGANIALNLSGNTSGSGQTYQWQSSAAIGGPYSNLSASQSSPGLGTPATTTLYYRCEVTCGTTATSTPVLVTVNPGLSGAYTINSLVATGGTNYQTFAAAVTALNCGISGPVVFNVSNGPYTEQVDIPQIGGASSTNTITFNGNNCSLTYAASVSTAPGTFILNGADYVTVNNLNISGTGGTYALTVHLWNGANNNTFSGCTISSPITAASTTQVPFSISGTATVYSGSGTSGNNNLVTGCTITGGYYGVTLYSSTTVGLEALNNTISNNTIRDAYGYNVYALYQSGALISGNDISRPNKTTSTTTAGVYLSTGDIGCKAEKNRIHNMFDSFLSSTSTCYGVAVLADGTAALPNRVENNLIYDMNGNGAVYGIYNSTGPYMLAYHNTIALSDQATTTGAAYGLYQTGATTGIDYRNNVVYITRSGTGIKRCVYFVSTTTGNTSNNNDLYMNATGGTNNHVGQYVSTNYTALSGAGGWQTANSNAWDQASVSTDPIFSNPGAGNYTPTTILLDNIGTGVGVATDILGNSRNGTTPDPGAYEFSVSAGMDIGAQLMVTPFTSGCYTNVQTIVIRIKNYGSIVDFSATPATVTCDVTGTTSASLSATLSSGTLAVNGTMDIPLTGTFDMSTNGGYTFNAYTTAGSDGNTLNDAMAAESRTRGSIVAGTLSANTTSFCLSGNPVLTLALNANGDRQWQSSTTSASGPWTNVGTGATTYSPAVSTTTYFQVETSCMAASAQSNVVTITVNNPQITGTTPGSHCGSGTVTLSAAGTGSTVNWYTAASGGSPVFTGPSYTTPVISSTTTYYAAASSGGFTGNVGKVAIESTAGTGGGLTTYVNFDAISNFTLQSVVLFPYGATDGVAGTVTIELRTSTGTPIMSQLVNVTAHSTPALSVPQTVTLNFPVTGGVSYRLGVNSWTGGVTNLYRDLTGTYPYTLPGVVSITGTSLAPYYYFFYNWTVSTGCESAHTPVVATITTAPSITPSTTLATVCNGSPTTLNVSSSNAGYDYTWTPGSLTGSSVSVNPTANTTYTVTAVDNSGGAFAGCGQVATVAIAAQPASATATATPSGICGVSGTTVVTLAPSSGYPAGTIQWQDSPNGSSYTDISGANTSSYSSPTLSSTTYYKALIRDGNNATCLQPTASVIIGVPSVSGTTPGTRCGTGTVSLGAAVSAGATAKWYTTLTGGSPIGSGSPFTTPVISSSTTYYVGAETGTAPFDVNVGTQSTTTQAGMPFRAGNATAFRTQYLYTASELSAAGIGAGTWNQFRWTVTTAIGAGSTMGNLTIRVGHTGVSALNATFQPSPSTTVYGPVNYVASASLGDITFNFSTVFNWDGVSNVLIEICHDNPSPSGVSGQVAANTTAFVSVAAVGNVCATAAGATTQSIRPVIKIAGGTGCASSRSAVAATVTPAPAITVASTTGAICPGGSADISVSSLNDPAYTYSWTSNPAGYTASGNGPHTVSPLSTTKYYVSATDNSGGANQGCAMIDSVTITNGGALVAGTVSTAQNSLCVSGSTVLTLNGASGGTNQWQSSTTSASGPWTNVGTGANSYSTGTITQTTYYRVVTSCSSSSVNSNVLTVTVNNPQLTSTTPGSRCGYGTVSLGATPSSGASVNWYTAPSGGTSVYTGTPFTTPSIGTTTTYYASASLGGSVANVGYLSAIPNGTSGVGITNYGLVFDALSSFTLYSVVVFPVSAASGTVGNITIGLYSTTGALLQSAVVSVTGNPAASATGQTVTLNFNIPAGTNYKLAPAAITGSGITGLLFLPAASAPGGNWGYPFTVPGVVSITTSTLTAAPTNTPRPDLYYYFYNWTVSAGCESARQAVIATVTPSEPISVSSTFPAVCTGGSTNLFVSSNIDPDYSYQWTSIPSGFNQTGAGPYTVSPTVTTTYYVLATNISGGANNGCTHLDSVTVVAGGTLASGTMSANLNSHCVSGNSLLTLSGASGGAIQWQRSFTSSSGPWTNVQLNGTTYNTGSLTQTAYYQAMVTCQTNSLTSNGQTITVNNPQLSGTSGATRCGPGTVSLSATPASGTVNWYTSPSGGTAIATGNNYSPNVTTTTTYYAAASFGGGLSSMGLPNRVGSTTNSGYSDIGLMFTATQAFTLQSVAIYPVATTPSGNVTATIALKNSAGTVLQSVVVSVPTSVSPGIKTLIPLNFAVPVGTNHRLVFTSASGGGLTGFIREITTGFTYPYTLSGIASITSAYTGGASASYYYYFYDWQVVTGCEGSRVPVTATVTPSPSVSATSSTNATICSGQSATLTATSSNPGYTYVWNPGSLSGASVTVSPTTTTTYTVSATDISGGTYNQCTAVATITVNASVSQPPQPSAFSNSPVCVGQSLTFFGNNNATGQASGNGWSWSGPSFSSTSQNPTISSTSTSNNGTYTLTVTNSQGCTASSSAGVTVNPNPVLSIATQTNVSCNGELDGSVDIDANNGTPNYLFDLDGSSTLDGIYSGLGAGTYSATVIDDNGCEATPLSVTITEPDVLTVSSGSNSPLCTGTTLNLASTPVGGTSGYSYAWTGPNGPVPAVQNPAIPSVTAADAGQYDLTITDAHGCTAGTNHTVSIIAAPTAAISNFGNNNICLSQPATVTLAFTGSGPWNYTVSDGSQTVSGSSSVTPANVNITPATAGTHNYTVTAITDANCPAGGTSTGTATVFVSTAPPTNNVGTPAAPLEACNGTVSLITVNSVGGQNIRYSWNTGSNSAVVLYSTNIGGPFSPPPFQTTTNQVYAQFGALAAGSGYNICVQGVNGCGSTNNKCVWVRGIVSVPGTITPANPVACPNDVKSYTCGSSGGASVYSWTLSGSSTPITSGQGTTNVQVTFPAGFTSGNLCVTAALACGGSSTSAPRCMTITNNPAIPAAFTAGPAKVCPGATGVIFTVPAVTGATGYSWTTPAGTTITSGQNTPSITVNFPASYTGAPPVCVSATSACGTSAARCKTVGSNIPTQPGSVTGPTTNICNSTVQYSISNVAGASTYNWTNPAGTTITSGQGSTTILLSVGSTFNTGQLTVTANTALCTPGTSVPRTITINGKPNVPASITANPAAWCNGDFVNFSAPVVTPAVNYNWAVTQGTITAGQGSNNIDVTWGTGTGNVTVNATNTCGASSNRVQSFTGLVCREEGLGEENTFSLYPNPAHDKVTVSIYVKEATQFNIKLRDMSGRVILSEDHDGSAGLNTYDVVLKNFAKGIYTLEVQSGTESRKTKVVIE